MESASVLKIQKTVTSKIELAKSIININNCFKGKHLSDTETTILAYFMVYGINRETKNLIVKSEICKNLNNIKTIMVILKKEGYIYKDELNGKVYVSKELSLKLTPTVAIYLKIDNKA